MIIYKATNLINGKIYIGKTGRTLKKRIKEHLYEASSNRCCYLLHKAIRKYGSENFKWEIIDRCLFEESLNELEKYYIKKFNSLKPNGYNIYEGGEGITLGTKMSTETRQKMSASRMGEKNPQYGMRKELSTNYGNKHTDEYKEHMSKRCSGSGNPFYGRKHKEETIKLYKQRVGNKNGFYGRKHTPESIQKMSESHKKTFENKKMEKHNESSALG